MPLMTSADTAPALRGRRFKRESDSTSKYWLQGDSGGDVLAPQDVTPICTTPKLGYMAKIKPPSSTLRNVKMHRACGSTLNRATTSDGPRHRPRPRARRPTTPIIAEATTSSVDKVF